LVYRHVHMSLPLDTNVNQMKSVHMLTPFVFEHSFNFLPCVFVSQMFSLFHIFWLKCCMNFPSLPCVYVSSPFNLLNLIIIISVEGYNLWSSLLYSFLHAYITSFFLDLNIHLRYLFPKRPLSLCLSLRMSGLCFVSIQNKRWNYSFIINLT
jgi:hypothetical protein